LRAFTVFDDGDGPALYAGGHFTTAAGLTVNRIAKWDGAQWSPLGSGVSASVRALTVYDDGQGPALYAAGLFPSAGGQPVGAIARWDGAAWSALAGGVSGGPIHSLAVHDDGSGPRLFAGGTFTSASGAGAVLVAEGGTSIAADDLVFHASRLLPGQPALLFVGDNAVNGGIGTPFGDGLRCAGGNVRRLGVAAPDASGGASRGPRLSGSGMFEAGTTQRFQLWYRDPSGSPCGYGFNLSNGYELSFVR
jgi:hypothetical protein